MLLIPQLHPPHDLAKQTVLLALKFVQNLPVVSQGGEATQDGEQLEVIDRPAPQLALHQGLHRGGKILKL